MFRLPIAIIIFGARLASANAHPFPAGQDCGATRVKSFVAKLATPAAIARIKLRSGAAAMRVIKPGMAVTMDFSPTRLNVELDERGRVKALRCF